MMTIARTLLVAFGYVVGWRCEDRAPADNGDRVGLRAGLDALDQTEITKGYGKVQVGFVRC
jgi:hypothetical protein